MPRKHTALVNVLASIADGSAPDWQALTGTLHEDDGKVVHELQVIANVATLHRTFQDDEPERVVTRPVGRGGPVVGRIEPARALPVSQDSPPTAESGSQWGHLRLLERIDAGAFGEVYKAWDPQLEREVAVKLLKPSGSSQQELERRVLHEGRTLARVRHENVVHVYGAEAHDGRIGLWMELVRGRTLEEIVQSQGQFGAREAAMFGQDVCRALAAVHQAGLIHRDVKANNVMREDGGRLVLMDFGAGQSREEGGAGRAGTPLYLAPELLAGGKGTVQSDIYSVGVLLYHLVTRSFPIRAGSKDDLVRAHAARDFARLQDARPDLPEGFVRVVERALHPDPAQRFASAGALGGALAAVLGSEQLDPRPARVVPPVDVSSDRKQRRLTWVVSAVLLGVAVIAAILLARQWSATPPPSGIDSIAVLPFRVLDGDVETAYFSEGVSDDISASISRLPGLRVISGMSVRRFRDSEQPLEEIGRALGVRTLLAGSVRVSGDQLRVVVQLVDAANSVQLWADTFDRNLTDVFAVQTEIAQRIGAALKGRLTSQEVQRLERKPIDQKAYDLYLRARSHLYKRMPEGARQALAYLREAITIEPNVAQLHASLAEAYHLSGVFDVLPTKEAFSSAEASALHAVRLDEQLADGHAALGIARHQQLRWVEAEASYKRALALNWNFAPAHHWYANWLAQRGRFQEALSEIEQARSLDPLAVGIAMARSSVLGYSGAHDMAIDQMRAILDVEPDYARGYAVLSELYLYKEDYEEALRVLDKAEELSPDWNDLKANRAYLYAATGKLETARELLAAVQAVRVGTPASPFHLATVYDGLGDLDAALEELKRARDEWDDNLRYALIEPKFVRLRNDPRFDSFLHDIGLKDK